jgi:hypothetical protein
VDVDGDHFFDLFVGVPGANRVAGFEVNPPCVTCVCHPHVKVTPRARQIAWNGQGIQILMNNKPPSSPADSFKMRLDASSPAGRTKIRLEWEVKDFGVPFSAEQTTTTGLIDTGAVAGGHSIYAFEQHVTTTTGPKKWRVRILSTRPLFPDSRWYYIADNAKDEADVLVASP